MSQKAILSFISILRTIFHDKKMPLCCYDIVILCELLHQELDYLIPPVPHQSNTVLIFLYYKGKDIF
jgi:hypothetical protein